MILTTLADIFHMGQTFKPPHTTLLDFHRHPRIFLSSPRLRMDDISQLDGSDAVPGASTHVQRLSALKEHLKSALLIMGAFDQSSFASLSKDNEYKHSVQRLLSPLTTLSLSSVVDQANEVLRSGLDAISARMSAIIDSPHPHSARLPTSSQGALLRQVANASATLIPRPNAASKPQGAPPSISMPGLQLSMLATLQNDTTKAHDAMISIHFLTGSCRPDANMQTIVYSINAAIRLRAMQRNQLRLAPSTVVVEARTTVDRDRLALAIGNGTMKMFNIADMLQDFDFSPFMTHGSVTHIRRGGTVEYVARLQNVSLLTVDAYSSELIQQTESYLARSWGQGIKLAKKISPFIYLCEGPAFALDRFCVAPKGSFDLDIQILPGRRRTISGITVEGLCLFDVFNFV